MLRYLVYCFFILYFYQASAQKYRFIGEEEAITQDSANQIWKNIEFKFQELYKVSDRRLTKQILLEFNKDVSKIHNHIHDEYLKNKYKIQGIKIKETAKKHKFKTKLSTILLDTESILDNYLKKSKNIDLNMSSKQMCEKYKSSFLNSHHKHFKTEDKAFNYLWAVQFYNFLKNLCL